MAGGSSATAVTAPRPDKSVIDRRPWPENPQGDRRGDSRKVATAHYHDDPGE